MNSSGENNHTSSADRMKKIEKYVDRLRKFQKNYCILELLGKDSETFVELFGLADSSNKDPEKYLKRWEMKFDVRTLSSCLDFFFPPLFSAYLRLSLHDVILKMSEFLLFFVRVIGNWSEF